jgi:hypothetical protein
MGEYSRPQRPRAPKYLYTAFFTLSLSLSLSLSSVQNKIYNKISD